MKFPTGPASRSRSFVAALGSAILAALLPPAPANAHVLSVVDNIDLGEQVASAIDGSQTSASAICVQVRLVDGIVQQLRVAIATDGSEDQQLEGRASEGSTLCSSAVAPGPFSLELTALAGQPGSTLHVDVLHGHATSDTFTPAASMAVERTGHGATLLRDGRVLVLGGETPGAFRELSAPSTSEIYDPISNTWEPAGGLKTYR